MKITIKKTIYTKAYTKKLMEEVSKTALPKKTIKEKKEKKIDKMPKTKVVSEAIEIPDELANKTIAVIDELLDRTYDDWEERGWTGVDFPLVPFPFFEKNRLPENVGVDDYWISYWLDTTLMNTITERSKIIEIPKKAEILQIKHHPILNESVGIFDGDKFDLVIDRDGLISLRRLIIKKQQKSGKKISEVRVKELERSPKKKEKQFGDRTLYLNQVGDLYREPKNKYCYEMGETGDRHKIIRFLAINMGYQPTKLIAVEAGNKNEQTVRTEIGKIRNNVEKYLKIKVKDFLQGKKGSGYRINPKYRPILKNE